MKFSLLIPFVGVISSSALAASVSASNLTAASTLRSLGVDTVKYPPVLGTPTYTCKILKLLFPKNETFTSSSPFYTPLFEEPWSQACWLEPACILTPNSSSDVSIIVRVLTTLQTKFAIRSGGHKPTPGFNSIGSDGVLLAMENLNTLAISADKNYLTVGTGNRWIDAYKYAKSQGKLVVGGRVPVVGVGGFLLEGGVSLFINHWGVALDNIVGFKIVLMDGSVVKATPTNYPDLFKGLKGGQSNFGIVTEFDLLTKPHLDSYYTVKVYSPLQTNKLLGVYGEYLANPETDPKSSVQVALTTNLSSVFYGYVDPSPGPKDFLPFSNITAVQTVLPPTNGSITDVIFGPAAAETTLGNWVGISYSHKVISGALMQSTWALIATASATLRPDMYLTYVPQGILPNAVHVGAALNGGNLLGIEPVPQVWVDLYMTYAHSADGDYATQVINDLYAEITKLIDAEGLGLPFLFANTAGEGQKVLRSQGEGNFEEIKRVAGKYDPKGYMQTLQNDGYLVSKG
ncbi:MAG: hypothetical protein Q9195_002844 [Heterodermia aff. obscurata]